jgi:two-component system NtrC family response regulator/two-component system response regulator AtoC
MFPRTTDMTVTETPRPRPRVLVVDDEPLIRWSIAEALGECGYPVIEAETGSAAIRAMEAATDPFGVVVLDLRLPDSDNLSLLTRLHELSPAAQIIMMTAHGTGEVAEEAQARGAFGFLNKPFELSAMASLVAEASGCAEVNELS